MADQNKALKRHNRLQGSKKALDDPKSVHTKQVSVIHSLRTKQTDTLANYSLSSITNKLKQQRVKQDLVFRAFVAQLNLDNCLVHAQLFPKL